MAITTLAGGATAGRTAGSVPYLVSVNIDLAAAATAKGTALAAADIIDLGTIDSGKKNLDLRFTVEFNEEDRSKSLNHYYLSKEYDLLKSLDSKVPAIEINPDIEWSKLLDGHI